MARRFLGLAMGMNGAPNEHEPTLQGALLRFLDLWLRV